MINVGTALSRILMSSAQRGQTIDAAGDHPPGPRFQTPINVGVLHVREIFCGLKFCVMHTLLFLWQYTTLK